MANITNEEVLQTRIGLKYDSYEKWTTAPGKDLVLKRGEVGFCAIGETAATGSGEATTAPTVLFKVGNGTAKFSELKWGSALAADVYDWAKAANAPDEYDTKYAFEIKDGKLQVTETTYTNGEAGTPKTTSYDFVTPEELTEILKSYYTKTEVDGLIQGVKDIVNGLDDSETTVVKGTGINVTDAGTGNDHAYTVALDVDGAKTALGLGSAAYVTVDSLNATAKGYADAVEAKLPTTADYGVLEVKGDEASGVVVDKTDAQRPIVKIAANTYDAHGAAAAVLGASTDAATANTVYGAKAAAAAAQNDATIAKTKIETFLGTITPDGSQEIIDTLTEINNYVGEHGEEFAELSGKVTEITKEGGTIDSKITAYDTSKKFGDIITHNVAEFATSEQGEKANTALQKINAGKGIAVTEKTNNGQTVSHGAIKGAEAKEHGDYNEDNRNVILGFETDEFGHVVGARAGDISHNWYTNGDDAWLMLYVGDSSPSAIEIKGATVEDNALVIPAAPVGTGEAAIASVADGVVTIKGGAKLNDHTLGNNDAADVTLAKVATTAKCEDLVDFEESVDARITRILYIDCGTATEVI